MQDIFLSYSHDDLPLAQALMLALTGHGWTVWFDHHIEKGQAFDEMTEDAISKARLTLVIWSAKSVRSRWVRAEAAFAVKHDKLLSIIVDKVEPPLQFLHIQGIDLSGWQGRDSELPFRELAMTLSERLDAAVPRELPQTPRQLQGQDATSAADFLREQWRLAREWFCPAVDTGFAGYFRDRTYIMMQFAAIAGFSSYSLMGLVDFVGDTASAELTRFRFLIGGPIFLLMAGLSFTAVSKRFSQFYMQVFCVIAPLVSYQTLEIVAKDPRYAPVIAITSMQMINFLILAAFMALVPLRLGNAAIAIGLLAGFGAWYITRSGLPPYLSLPNLIILMATCGIALLISLFRERMLRLNYREQREATTRIAELTERILATGRKNN